MKKKVLRIKLQFWVQTSLSEEKNIYSIEVVKTMYENFSVIR